MEGNQTFLLPSVSSWLVTEMFYLHTTITYRPFQLKIWFASVYEMLVNSLTPGLNPTAQRCLKRFLLEILLLETCISLIYAWKPNKCTKYSFSLLIMYGSSNMFRHYIVILRERFYCLLRDAQLRSSRQNIVVGRVVSSDVVHTPLCFATGKKKLF
jgi:hypothetical protein